MGTYRLNDDARADVQRVYVRGLRAFGEGQADAYVGALLDERD